MADVITWDGYKSLWTLVTAASTTNYNPPMYLFWGTSGTAATSNTDLGSRAAPTTATGVTGTRSVVTTTTSGDSYRVTGTITSTSSLSITEVGIKDSATSAGSNLLYWHSTFGAISVVSGDSIAFTLTTVATTT